MAKVPKGWDIAAHQAWLVGDKAAAMNSVMAAINTYGPSKPLALMKQVMFYLFFLGDYASCVDVIRSALAQYPDDEELHLNHVVALARLDKFTEAIAAAEPMIASGSNNYTLWDSLARNYYNLGVLDKAKEAGTRALTLKDEAHGAPVQTWKLPKTAIEDMVASKHKVISFSLWGNGDTYLYGALQNLSEAKRLYPDWQLWFYVDNSVSPTILQEIKARGGKVLVQKGKQTTKEKLCWRFKVANRADVGYFLVRDIDSVVGERERDAVGEWIKSGKHFHIMRDWWTHTDLILAGMWGGVAGVLPNVTKMLKTYDPGNVETPNVDQWFLRDMVWRYVKPSVMIHDRCFDHMSPRRFETVPEDIDIHIGRDEGYYLTLDEMVAREPILSQLVRRE